MTPAALVGSHTNVTTTLSSKGQVVIPAEIRKAGGLKPGDDLIVSQRPGRAGEILLKKINRSPKLSLVEHLRRLKGLNYQRPPEFSEPPPNVRSF